MAALMCQLVCYQICLHLVVFLLSNSPECKQGASMAKIQSEPRVTKHRQIFDFLRESIVSGNYKAGDQLPTEEELVRQFDTSRPTVSKAMRELTGQGLIERRAGSGTFVKASMDTQGKMLGLLIPGLGTTEIFEPICAQLSGSAQANGLSLMWGNSTPLNGQSPVEQAEALCSQYIDQKVSGVFFAPIELEKDMYEANRRIARRFSEAGIAVVLLDRDLEPYPQRSEYDLVAIDNRRAAYTLVKHLLEGGCDEIHFLARPFSAPTVDARIAGYREALLDHDINPRSGLIHRVDANDISFMKKIARKNGRVGVLCANDATAARLMHALDEADVAVPDEVCVAGFDDVKYAQLLRVPLTTWHQPCVAMGVAAFNAMHDRIKHPDLAPHEILLHGELVVRSSTEP